MARRYHHDGMDKQALSASPTVDKDFVSLMRTISLRGNVKMTVIMCRTGGITKQDVLEIS